MAEASIDLTRPALKNADGSISTEQTITIEQDGRYFNIPTIVDGKRRSEDEAVQLFRAGLNPPVGEYGKLDEAVSGAQSRSERIGDLRAPQVRQSSRELGLEQIRAAGNRGITAPDKPFGYSGAGLTPIGGGRDRSPMLPGYFDPIKAEPEQPKAGGSYIGDLWASFASGSNSLLKIAGDAYALITGDTDNWASNAGQSGMDYWQQTKSTAQKDAEARRKAAVDAAPDELGKLWAYVKETATSPRLLSTTVTEQIPQTIVPGGAGAGAARGALAAGFGKVAAVKAGVGTAVGAGAVMQGADVAGDQLQDLTKRLGAMNAQQAMGIPEVAELVNRGATIDEAKAAYALSQARKTAGAAGAISVGSQMLPGARVLERVMAGGKAGVRGRLAATAAGTAGEAAQESLEEGGGLVARNALAQGVDPGRPLTQNLGETVGQAALSGGAMGGAAGFVGAEGHPSQPIPPGTDLTGEQPQAPVPQLTDQSRRLLPPPEAQQQDSVPQLPPPDDGSGGGTPLLPAAEPEAIQMGYEREPAPLQLGYTPDADMAPRMVVDQSTGQARPMTPDEIEDAVIRARVAQNTAAETARIDAELGLTPDVRRAQQQPRYEEPGFQPDYPEYHRGNPNRGNRPYLSHSVAQSVARREGGEVTRVQGGWVISQAPQTPQQFEQQMNRGARAAQQQERATQKEQERADRQAAKRPAQRALDKFRQGRRSELLSGLRQIGVNIEEASDAIGSRQEARRVSPGLFRRSGRGIDEVIEWMSGQGWLPPDAIGHEDVYEQQAYDLIRAAVYGDANESPMKVGDEEEAGALERDARDEEETEAYYSRSGSDAADVRAAIDDLMAAAQAEGLDLEAVLERVALENEDATDADYQRAVVAELERRVGPRPDVAEQADAGGTEDRAGRSGEAVDGEPPAFDLENPTPEGLRTQAALDQQQQAAAARRDAAPPPEDFTLTGSSSQADEAIARGQLELTPDQAAHAAATSPANDRPEPTEAQKEAGNYAKGHVRIAGLDISIENPAGTRRRPEWPVLPAHYGYIRNLRVRADSAKDASNNSSADAYLFGDLGKAKALRAEGFNRLGVNDKKVVQGRMVAVLHDSQVLGAVVESVPVDVVNVLVGKKLATEQLLRNPAMLLDRLAAPLDDSVAATAIGRFIDAVATSHPSPLARLGAEKQAALGVGDSVGANVERGAATRTRDDGSHSAYFAPKSRDGDHIDVFINPDTPTDFDGRVFVIDQNDPKSGKFDESKAMIGFASQREAVRAYRSAYTPGWRGFRDVTPMTMDQFKAWALDEGATRKPAGDFDGSKARDGSARAERDDDVSPVAERQGSVPQSGKPVLPQLRGEGDSDARGVAAELQRLRKGRRAADEPAAHTGAQGQQRALRAGQRDLGDQEAAGAQPTEESSADSQRPDQDAGRVGGDNRAGAIDAALSSEQRNVAGGRDRNATQGRSKVERELDALSRREAAKAKVGNALDELASLLGAKKNLTPEQRRKLLPILTDLMSGLFDMGHLSFKAAARRALELLREKLGALADEISLRQLKAAYNSAAEGVEGTDSEAAVNATDSLEGDDVSGSGTDLESDRSDTVDQKPGVPSSDADGRDGAVDRTGSDRRGAGQRGDRLPDDPRVPHDGTAPVREQGDLTLDSVDGGSVVPGSTAGAGGREGSDAPGVDGVQPDESASDTLDAVVEATRAFERRLADQRRAAGVKHQAADLKNIRESLPLLLPAQHNDVVVTEKRFAKPIGYGVLFTNGTGTGKTFTGLGAVYRFAKQQGKSNILIIAPGDKVIDDWIHRASLLNIPVTRLAGTKDAGNGVVITTYENVGANDALAFRKWDLVVVDEAHKLMQSEGKNETIWLQNLRGITYHPRGADDRAKRLHRDLYDEVQRLSNALDEVGEQLQQSIGETRAKHLAEHQRLTPLHRAAVTKWEAARDAVRADVEANQGAVRPRALFLSATPFAYREGVDWAEGYLFDYSEGAHGADDRQAYNQGSHRDQFFMRHFGYRMRYNKLTKPPVEVNVGLMERAFNGWLQKSGALSARSLDVPFDYDRRFVMVDSAIGKKIDEALAWLVENDHKERAPLAALIREQFDYNARTALLERIKATEVIPLIKSHMALGRKVVVFHERRTSKHGQNDPFSLTIDPDLIVPVHTGHGKPLLVNVYEAYQQFRAAFPELFSAGFRDMPLPVEALTKAFPSAAVYNGDAAVKSRRLKGIESFNTDASGVDVVVIQTAAGKEGISAHDTTGTHQRVLFNLGLPVAPVTAIQQEGRIFRVGQASDAMFRYLNTGTNWERWAFAQKISERVGTAENLSQGEAARGLKDAFIVAFEDSGEFPAGHEGEGKGGKLADRALVSAITPFERAKSYYFATKKKSQKDKAREGVDYYPTPEPLGFKMVEWLGLQPTESALEPSAGHGAIARWFPDHTTNTAIEPSMELASRLAMSFDGGKIINGQFEDHEIINKYDGIAMNPPYGHGGKTAMEHVAKAFKHLRPGGRLIAIIPSGLAMEKRFDKWMYGTTDAAVSPKAEHPTLGKLYAGDVVEFTLFGATRQGELRRAVDGADSVWVKISGATGESQLPVSKISAVITLGPRAVQVNEAQGAALVVSVDLPTVTFERAATQVASRIIVIDKELSGASTQQVSPRDLTDIATINELFDRVENMTLPPRPQKAEEGQRPAKAPLTADGLTADKFDQWTQKHGKTGADQFMAAMKGRLSREDYQTVADMAKRHGGYWQRYQNQAQGVRQGFVFETDAGRQAFMREAAGGIVESRAPSFAADLETALADATPPVFTFKIGDPSPVLLAAGIPPGTLQTSAKIVTKALYDHGVPKSVLKQLPELLDEPVMVFESDTQDNSFVVVTDKFVNGKALLVIVQPTVTRGAVALNFVPSLYPKDQIQSIQRWLNAGKLRYLDKSKSPEWFASARLQLPREWRTPRGPDANVATNETIVKPPPELRRGTTNAPPREGLSVSEAQKVADTFVQKFPGAGSLQVRVVESVEDIPAARRPSPYAEGAYHATDGVVYLVAGNIATEARAARVMLHEIVGHFGVEALLGKDFAAVAARVRETARAKGPVTGGEHAGDANYATIESVRKAYPDYSAADQSREVLARMAEASEKPTFLELLYMRIRAALQKLGINLKLSNGEIKQLVINAAHNLRNGMTAPQAEASAKVARESVSQMHSLWESGQMHPERAVESRRSPQAPKWADGMAPDVLGALKKAGIYGGRESFKERIDALKQHFWTRLRQSIFDQYDPIKNIDDRAYMMARLSRSADQGLEALLMYGRVKLTDGALDVNYEKGGLVKELQALEGEQDRFMAWIAGNRARHLKAQGRENLFTDQDITALASLDKGKMESGKSRATVYAEVHEKFKRYNKSVLDIAEQTGLIDPESRALWEQEFYIPFYRVIEEGGGGPTVKTGLVNQQAFKKLRGGDAGLRDLLANTLLNWSHLMSASLRNQAALRTLTKAADAGAAIEIPSKQIGKDMKLGTNVLRVMDEGQARYFMIEDPMLLAAVTSLEYQPSSGPVMGAMRFFKRWLTFGVTANPTFVVRNLIRDTISSMATTEVSYNPFKNVIEGWNDLAPESQKRAQMIASGAIFRFGSMTEGNREEHVRRLIDAGVEENTIVDRPHKVAAMLQKLWDHYQEGGDRFENANRAALYAEMRRNGADHLAASYAARDLMDFSAQGTSAAIRFLVQTVPFFNARLQGMYKLGRAAADNPKRMGYVIGAVALASIALLLAYHDDDDWKKREEWDRDNFWWLKLNGVAFRIPKPFEVGAIGSLAERMLEWMISNEPKAADRFMASMGNIVMNNLSMNPTPQLVKPIIDLYANTDSFTGRPIEPAGTERLSRSERAAASTTTPAWLLGQLGILSPVQVDHLVSAYFGWVGSAAMAAGDEMLRPATDRGDRASRQLRDLFFVGNFVEGLPANQSRYVTMLYEQAVEAQQAMADYRNARQLGNLKRAEEIFTRNRALIAQAPAYEAGKAALAQINRRSRAIEASTTMTATQKRAELDKLSAERDRIARVTVERTAAVEARPQ